MLHVIDGISMVICQIYPIRVWINVKRCSVYITKSSTIAGFINDINRRWSLAIEEEWLHVLTHLNLERVVDGFRRVGVEDISSVNLVHGLLENPRSIVGNERTEIIGLPLISECTGVEIPALFGTMARTRIDQTHNQTQ